MPGTATAGKRGPVRFCAYNKPREGETQRQAMKRLEARIGRRFGERKIYYYWDQPFPTGEESADAKAGRIPFISWKPKTDTGKFFRWRDIAAGEQDELIQAKARATKAWGEKWGRDLIITFHQEPENDRVYGSPADFVAAFRHVVDVFERVGVKNVLWAPTLMVMTIKEGRADEWYPGDDYVDRIGLDGYSWYPGRPGTKWRSFREIFQQAYEWAVSKRKKILIAETGVLEDPDRPGRKARWFKDALATLKEWPQVRAFCYFNSNKNYNWPVGSTRSSFAAFKKMGEDPWMQAGLRD